MAPRARDGLTDAERQAIHLVQDLRRQVAGGELPEELERPERVARHVILLYHGHVQIRMSRIAPALGVTMRTLERSFKLAFEKSMKDLIIQERLSFAQGLISNYPDLKIGVVAKHLGYDDPNVFERFFQKHAHCSPRAWQKAGAHRRQSGRRGHL